MITIKSFVNRLSGRNETADVMRKMRKRSRRTIRRMLMKRRRRKRSRKWPVQPKEEEDEEKDGKFEFIDVHKNAGKCQEKRVVITDIREG